MKNLSDSDIAEWVHVLKNPLAQPATIHAWIEGPLKRFFSFERVVLAHGNVIADRLTIEDFLHIGHSSDYVMKLQKTFDVSTRGALKWWLRNRVPFFIDPDCPLPFVTSFELEEIEEFDLKNVAGHGVLSVNSSTGCYIGFSGLSGHDESWYTDALGLIAPQVADIYIRHLALVRNGESSRELLLTGREKSIIRLLGEGFDTKTIARRIGISEKTVRNQLTKIYARAGVSSRGQLIARLRILNLTSE